MKIERPKLGSVFLSVRRPSWWQIFYGYSFKTSIAGKINFDIVISRILHTNPVPEGDYVVRNGHLLARTSPKSVEVPPWSPPKKIGDFLGVRAFCFYFTSNDPNLFKEKTECCKYSKECMKKVWKAYLASTICNFAFSGKLERFFQDFWHFESFKIKFWKIQRNFTALKHNDFWRFSGDDLLNKIAKIFLILKYVVVFMFSQHLLKKITLWILQ